MDPYINPYYPAGQDKIDDIPIHDETKCEFCKGLDEWQKDMDLQIKKLNYYGK